MKQKIIIKEKIDWEYLNPIVYFLGLMFSLVTGLIFIFISFIPMLNWYWLYKRFKSDEESKETPNPLIKEVKYRVIKQTKIIEEVLEEV